MRRDTTHSPYQRIVEDNKPVRSEKANGDDVSLMESARHDLRINIDAESNPRMTEILVISARFPPKMMKYSSQQILSLYQFN